MTLRSRERFYRAAFAFSALALAGFGVALWDLGPEGLGAVRPSLEPVVDAFPFYASAAEAGFCGLFAAAVLGVVAFRNGKTVSLEIFFFAAWAFGLSLETARGASLWLLAGGSGVEPLALVTRLALFGRYLGAIAMFMGSLFAAGLGQERVLPALGMSALVALFFASAQPLNSGLPGADFLVDLGNRPFAMSLEAALALLTFVDYVAAWRNSRDRVFLSGGAGAALCMVAAILLRDTASPWVTVAAAPAMVAGAWLFLSRFREYYVWR